MFTSKKKILFGTGTSAEILLKSTDLNIAYIIDNDEKKWGETFYNKKYIALKKLKEKFLPKFL